MYGYVSAGCRYAFGGTDAAALLPCRMGHGEMAETARSERFDELKHAPTEG